MIELCIMLMRIVEDTNLPMQQSLICDYMNHDEDWYYKIPVTFKVYDVAMILVHLISFYTFSLQSIMFEVRVSQSVHLLVPQIYVRGFACK